MADVGRTFKYMKDVGFCLFVEALPRDNYFVLVVAVDSLTERII